jgi:AAA+ ATPase superfamily predicted ATPase
LQASAERVALMNTGSKDNFQPIANPYIVGNPIREQKMFFGREDDFKFIRQKVTGGKKGGLLVLCGSRRSGKTSILFQIMNGRLGEDFFPVLIDMQAMTVENDLDFMIKLGRAIIEAIGDPGISLERDFLAKTEGGSLEAFQNLINKINERLGGKKLILLFDEYEIFETHIGKGLISKDILNLFANWIEHKQGVFIVFTGSDKLEERKAEYWEHFLGKALHRRISFLTETDTLRLIVEPLADVIQYEPLLPEHIYELTAGQPFYTQVICQALVDHLNEVHRYEVTADDLHDVAGQIIENPLPQMIFAWNSLTNIEKLALSIIGELNSDEIMPVSAEEILAYGKNEKIGLGIDPNTLNETLERLFHHDIIDKESDENKYTFKMDVWRRWTARMHSIWQVIDEIKGGEGELGEGLEWQKRGKRARTLTIAAAIALIAGSAYMYINDRRSADRAGAVAVDSTRVTITTEPPNAYVLLDDRRIGQTPLENRTVPAANAVLRIELAGYKPAEGTVMLRPDEPFDTLITLIEQTGGVRVTSAPRGARISLDGERTSFLTPWTFDNLSVNTVHEVRLVMAGYDPLVASVQVYEDSVVASHYDLARSMASVRIESDPPEALIFIDGKPAGKTPEVQRLAHGRHRLRLEREGYATKELTIRVPTPGNEVRSELQKLPPGKLTIKVVPYAEIYIDGALVTQATRHELSLSQGSYTIMLRHPTYGTVTRVVQVLSDREEELSINMSAEGVVQQ